MFAVSASARDTAAGDGRTFLPLSTAPEKDAASGVSGWPARHLYGMTPLSDGTWLVSTSSGSDGARYATATGYASVPTQDDPSRLLHPPREQAADHPIALAPKHPPAVAVGVGSQHSRTTRTRRRSRGARA